MAARNVSALHPPHPAVAQDENFVLGHFECWDERGVEAKHGSARHPADAAVGNRNGVAVNGLQPITDTVLEIGVAFAAARPPAENVGVFARHPFRV